MEIMRPHYVDPLPRYMNQRELWDRITFHKPHNEEP